MPVSVTAPAAAAAAANVASKRHVVMHAEHGHLHLPHSSADAWEVEMGLVVLLVGVHVAALCFWMYLLLKSKPGKRQGAGAGGKGTLLSAAALTRRAERATERQWRTPAEILAAWRNEDKQRLGKV